MNAHRDQHNTVVLIQSPKMFDSNHNLIGSIELRYIAAYHMMDSWNFLDIIGNVDPI